MKKALLTSIILILLTAVGLSAVSLPRAAIPVVSIEKVGENLKLDWEDITGAESYQIYEADTPQGPWTPIMPAVQTSEYLIPNPASKKFYCVSSIEADGPPAPEGFVFVEGGTFNIGAVDVTVASFYMNIYEVTQADYYGIIGSDPSYFAGNPDFPVERVSWVDAALYCNARSVAEGLTPCFSYVFEGVDYGTDPDYWYEKWTFDEYFLPFIICDSSANGYRLPTSMEWIYAAKGGNLTPASGYSIYAGSNVLDEVAWHSSNSGGTPHNVGTKLPNELGIYDMSGNIREWCWQASAPHLPEGEMPLYQPNHGGDFGSAGAEFCNIITGASAEHMGGSNRISGFRVVRSGL